MRGKSILHLTLDEVLLLHERLLARFGGAAGVRDLGLLESALYRPRTGYYPSLLEMAAALFESLLMNHAFVDGNKRVAFFATDVFLRINGTRLEVEPRRAHAFLVGLIERGQCNKERLLPWLRNALRRTGPAPGSPKR